MLSLLVTVFFVCVLHVNATKKVNVEVTLHSKDAFKLFSEDETFGIEYKNKTANIVQLNVVIDESKSMEIRQLKKDIIISYNIIYPDVDDVINKEFARLNNITKWTPSLEPEIFFLDYRTWLEYQVFLLELLAKYGDILSRRDIGTTIEGHSIPLYTISTGGGSDKPAFYIQAELHAREWLANAATMWILNALLEGYRNNDADITSILNAIDFYIVPTVNIDGYQYSWSGSGNTYRLWRKNRRNNGDGTFGVDLNRNYDAPDFCGVGASNNPSSNTYCGTAPFSEPESNATAQFMLDNANNIHVAWDMHTSGPLILYPWAYTYDQAPDYAELSALGDELQAAVHSVNGHVYTAQQAADLYPCAGTMADFVYYQSDYNIISNTFEGRGPGFDPPASNIIPAGQEQFAGVITMAKYIMQTLESESLN